jgi:hypothetical protein
VSVKQPETLKNLKRLINNINVCLEKQTEAQDHRYQLQMDAIIARMDTAKREDRRETERLLEQMEVKENEARSQIADMQAQFEARIVAYQKDLEAANQANQAIKEQMKRVEDDMKAMRMDDPDSYP